MSILLILRKLNGKTNTFIDIITKLKKIKSLLKVV